MSLNDPSAFGIDRPETSTLDLDDEYAEFMPRDRDRDRSPRGRRSAKPFFRDAVENPDGGAVGGLPGATDKDGAYPMTYKPARYEGVWLAASLRSFYEQELIVDVLGQVKGGKEASVYRCRANPRLGVDLLAAKVYRPRQFRNLRNDALYREGRPLISAGGSAIPKRDRRTMLAVTKKTDFGAQLQHTSWLMHEYRILDRLARAGAAVPRPFASNENSILMSYYGDERRAAPALNEINLAPEEAEPLFREIVRNIELMLSLGLIHGDLSAYNVLYWEGKVVLIDFPQGVSSDANQSAAFILQRDVQRICDYFARQGVATDPEEILMTLPEGPTKIVDRRLWA